MSMCSNQSPKGADRHMALSAATGQRFPASIVQVFNHELSLQWQSLAIIQHNPSLTIDTPGSSLDAE
jgi:hypothetical protein